MKKKIVKISLVCFCFVLAVLFGHGPLVQADGERGTMSARQEPVQKVQPGQVLPRRFLPREPFS